MGKTAGDREAQTETGYRESQREIHERLDVLPGAKVSNQNVISLLYIMLEIHHSGREPSKCKRSKDL